MALRKSSGGFTLIELMVVVAIVAILLVIGLPAYQDQVYRGNRAAAKAAMLDIANRQQQFLLSDRTYASLDTLTTSGYVLPDELKNIYTFDISTVAPASAPFFTLTFTATGVQLKQDAKYGPDPLTLNSEGKRLPVDKWER